MKYLQNQRLYELKNLHENKKEFWKDFDFAIKNLKGLQILDFLHSKYPKIVKDDSDFYDKLISIHNEQKIPKRYSFTDWLYMWILTLQPSWGKNIIDMLNISNFEKFFFKEKTTLYRGVPARRKYNFDKNIYEIDWNDVQNLNENKYYSFSFDKKIALQFTQPGWSIVTTMFNPIKDVEKRNGFIYELSITPKDIHIVNDVGNEHEAIVKGPIDMNNVKIYKVIKGKFE